MEFQPKNSTTAKKPGNDMKRAPAQKPRNMASNKADYNDSIDVPKTDSMNHKQSSKYSYNQQSGVCNEDTGINQTQMPNKKGNIGTPKGQRVAPNNAKGASVGSRKWMPSEGQNYVGNPDKIQMRQGFNRLGNKEQ
jgi:hypothetical protein